MINLKCEGENLECIYLMINLKCEGENWGGTVNVVIFAWG